MENYHFSNWWNFPFLRLFTLKYKRNLISEIPRQLLDTEAEY